MSRWKKDGFNNAVLTYLVIALVIGFASLIGIVCIEAIRLDAMAQSVAVHDWLLRRIVVIQTPSPNHANESLLTRAKEAECEEPEGDEEIKETIHITFVSIYLVIDPDRLKPQPKPEEANQGILLVASQGI